MFIYDLNVFDPMSYSYVSVKLYSNKKRAYNILKRFIKLSKKDAHINIRQLDKKGYFNN